MHFDITRKNEIKNKSFRVAKLYDQFDLNDDSFEEKFEGDIDLEKDWQVGVIVGKSGTGKSTIARELFGQYMFTPKYKAARRSSSSNRNTFSFRWMGERAG